MDHRQQVESLQQTAKRSPTQTRRGTIAQVASRSTEDQHLRDLARLRRVRDRIDREYAQPLDVETLARDANMSAGHLSRQFKIAYGESPYSYLMTRRIERATALLRRGDLERHRGLFRGRLLVAGNIQHPLHRAGRRLPQHLSGPDSSHARRDYRRAWKSR